MLVSLQVKNLALIEEEEIAFADGLNILTGETGAGKSIILGALSMALGAKVDKAMLRSGENDAYVEAVFQIDDDMLKERLREQDIECYDGEVILSRRIAATRAVAKINGESVPAKKLREAGALLLDIYGQQEHVSLLKKSQHLTLLDAYAGKDLSDKKQELAAVYRDYRKTEEEYAASVSDETERERELLFLRHETDEIEGARLSAGEDEQVEEEYHRLSHAQKIMEAVGQAYQAIEGEETAERVGRALREITAVAEYDETLQGIGRMLSDIEALLSDAGRELADFQNSAEYDGEHFAEVEERLNTINRLKDKYGPGLEEVFAALEERQKRIEELEHYDSYLAELKKRRETVTAEVERCCEEVSQIRQRAAKRLCQEVSTELTDLNFLNVSFSMQFERTAGYAANGYDDAEFVISLNPGTAPAPLREIASGGELSRIMLAIKTVLARTDEIDTLIFDEIDTGISGRTAQAVAEKLRRVAETRQVICITHLPQIAAQADRHFRIEKHLESDATISAIHPLDEEGCVEELARMLGGAEITETVRQNARELRAAGRR